MRGRQAATHTAEASSSKFGEAVGERSLLVDVDVARAAGTAPFGAGGDLTQRFKFGEDLAHMQGLTRLGVRYTRCLKIACKTYVTLVLRWCYAGVTLVDVDVARAAGTAPFGGGAHSFSVGDHDRYAACWGWGRGALL